MGFECYKIEKIIDMASPSLDMEGFCVEAYFNGIKAIVPNSIIANARFDKFVTIS